MSSAESIRVRRGKPLWRGIVIQLAILGFAGVFFTQGARAEPLTLSVLEPSRLATPGDTLIFSGTITNNTGLDLLATDLFLNFSGFDFNVVDLVQLLGTTDFALNNGDTSAVVDLFSFGLGAGALPGQTYVADVFLLDSNDNFSNIVTVDVTAAEVTPVPEPSDSLLLCFTALVLLAAIRRLGRKGAALLLLVFLMAQSGAIAQTSAVRFVIGEPGLGLDGATLQIAIPIVNEGTAEASNVQVRSISLGSATRIQPATFPVTLGDIEDGKRIVLPASFSGGSLVATGRYLLTVRGSYVLGGRTLGFAVNRYISPPKPSPGEAVARNVVVPFVRKGPFPPSEILAENEGEDRNSEFGLPIPAGPFRAMPEVSAPTPVRLSPTTGSLAAGVRQFKPRLQPQRAGAGLAAAPDPVGFLTNTAFGAAVTFTGVPPDMSGASNGNVVFTTGNTFGAFSSDGGVTFTQINPTTVFGPGMARDAANNLLDNGPCCDQIVQYAPQIDRFIWLLQYWGAGTATPGGSGGPNKLSIAVASTADLINSTGSTWTCCWDLTSGLLGVGNMDYPDMAVGDNFLYVSVDVVGVGLLVMRMPLAQLRDVSGGDVQLTNAADSRSAYGGHLMQNPGTRMFWAGHTNTSTLRIFSWAEGTNTYTWKDVEIADWNPPIGGFSYSVYDYSSITPDGTDWLNKLGDFPGSAVVGLARAPFPFRTDLWFAFTAPRNLTLLTRYPYIRLVQVDEASLRLNFQYDISNPDFAFAYPSLATNSKSELGLSMGWGGGPYYANHAVGIFPDDPAVATSISQGSINRWGDYVTVRRHATNPALFSAEGYSVVLNPGFSVCVGAGSCGFNPTYTLFGRSSDLNGPDFVSDPSWQVYAVDPATPGATPLGAAQRVCISAASPPACPPGSMFYNVNVGAGGWIANLSSIPDANWIWAPGVTGSTENPALQQFFFTKTFQLGQAPTAGRILIAVDDFAEVQVNGTVVGSTGSITDVTQASAGQNALVEFNILPFLQQGTNTVTIRAQNGPDYFGFGCSGTCTYATNPAGVVFGGSIR